MFSKLLSMLGGLKGGAVAAAVIALSATTASVAGQANVGHGLETAAVAASNAPAAVAVKLSELANTVQQTVANVTNQQTNNNNENDEDAAENESEDHDCGQPLVVAQRNLADKELREAFQDQHTRLMHLRGKDSDKSAIKSADKELKSTLRDALNDIAKLTLGREGQIKFDEEDETSTSGAHPQPCSSPAPEHGAVTLTAAQQAIVDAAVAKMKAIVDAVATALGTTQTTQTHGKSDEHGKSGEHGKPATAGKSGEHGRPTTEDHDD